MIRKRTCVLASGLLFGALVVAGCGPEEKRQVPSSPTGSIVGQVTTLADGTPVAGVEVVVLLTAQNGAREVTVTTGDDGTYTLSDLAAGVTYTVFYYHPNYVARMAQVAIPNAAGDFPQGNAVVTQDVTMAPPDASLVGVVFGSNGIAAAGAVVRVDLRPLGFDLVVESVTGSDGSYAITGLPGAPAGLAITAVVAPYDEDGDGLPEYGALSGGVDLFPGTASILDFDLRTASPAFVLLHSDVDDGRHPAADPIDLAFNQEIDLANTRAFLHDDDRNQDIVARIVPDPANPNGFAVVTEDGNPFTIGVDYTLTVDARSVLGLTVRVVRPFVATGSAAALAPVTGLQVFPGDANWRTRTFDLIWDYHSGAAGYQVFVRDNRNNTTFQHVASVGNAPTPYAQITLPTSFDVFSGDGILTPFAYFGQVDFAVVPVDSVGTAGSVGAAEVVSRIDSVSPRINSWTQVSGQADNTAGTGPETIVIDVTFTEYMDDVPFTLTTNGAGVTFTFVLDPGLMSGTFTITIPAGVDASGAVAVDGGSDTSGNPLETYNTSLLSLVDFVSNGDFELGLTDWTGSLFGGSGTTRDPTALDDGGNMVGCLGNPAAPMGGDSYLEQQITIPANIGTAMVGLRYRFTSDDGGFNDFARCRITTTGGTQLYQFFSEYGNSATGGYVPINDTTGTLNGYTTVVVVCQLSQWGPYTSELCVDDIYVVGLVP